MDREFLKEAAKAIHAKLPDNYGFILFAMPLHGEGDKRLVYVSNIERADAIASLKEWMLKCGAAEDWMKHIK
jgi:hypothetical protein